MQESDFGLIVDEDVLSSFTNLDYNIYNALLRSGKELIDMRVTDLATMAGVSSATVVRFCKKCGYAGFPDLKMALITKGTGSSGKGGRLPSVVEDIQDWLSTTDLDDFRDKVAEAYEILRWARGIYVVGYGRSGGLAKYTAYLFANLGVFTLPIVEFPPLLHMNYSAVGGDAAGIVISYSGATPMAVSVAQDLTAQGTPVVGITANPASPLARISDVCISYKMPFNRTGDATRLETCLPALAALEQLARMMYNSDLAID